MARIEKGSYIGPHVIYGPECIFGHNCVVKGFVELGYDTVIGSLALVEGDEIRIGSGTRIMPFAAIGSNTTIGINCFIGPYFTMANACKPGPNAKLEHLIIGDNVMIGTGTLVRPGVTIGNNVKVNMGSQIYSDVPDDTHVRGRWPPQFQTS